MAKIEENIGYILRGKINQGNAAALPYIKTFGEPYAGAHYDIGMMVAIVLEHPMSTPEMIDAVCQAFVDIGTEGYWVMTLSTFTDMLWERRALRWIKKFNEITFGLAENGQTHCCHRLVGDFVEYARWDDDPAEFHLKPNTEWLRPNPNQESFSAEFLAHAENRIRAGKFASEAEFLLWKQGFKS